MKLTDQIFAVMPPDEWHTAIEIPFPDAWRAMAPQLKGSDIEELVWQCNFVVVASYVSDRDHGRFVVYEAAAKPNQLSVVCSESGAKLPMVKSYLNKIRVWRCGCCATLSY